MFRKFLVWLFLFAVSASSLHAEKTNAGLAWHVKGAWQLDGKGAPIRAGDAIPPASLLQPDETVGNYSINILLPDGQHVLYECFTAVDCARGFRVPALLSRPDPFALNMLARIRSVLSGQQDAAPNAHRAEPAPQMARQTAVAVLDAANRVQVAGLIADLPEGRYTYELRSVNNSYPPQLHLVLEKTAPAIELPLPAAGLYDITITDALNTPRVNLFLAAIRPAQSARFQSFQRARATMKKWNEDYTGWPIEDFLRAYLESLMTKPLGAGEVQ